MHFLSDKDFLTWASESGISPDPRWPTSAQLVFSQSPELSRFWLPSGTDLPGFLSTAFTAASAEGPYWIRHRGGGRWFEGETASFRQTVIERLLAGLGIPPHAEGALQFTLDEWGMLLLIANTFYTFGWHVGTDLEIIPDNRSCILMLGHHGDLSGQFPTEQRMQDFIADMAGKGFRLPDRVPDSTFKKPEWMARPRGTA
jgi:hypothetical protein